MTQLTMILLAFVLVGAGIGWAIHHSWWTPILGGAIAGVVAIGLFLWMLSKTDIG